MQAGTHRGRRQNHQEWSLCLQSWAFHHGSWVHSFREPRSSRQGGTHVSSLLKGVVVLTTPGHWVAVAVGPGTQPSTPTSHSGRAQKPYTTPDPVETPVKLLQHSHAPPPPMQRIPSLKESQTLGKGPTSQWWLQLWQKNGSKDQGGTEGTGKALTHFSLSQWKPESAN